MWHIVVTLWLGQALTIYALPTRYVGMDDCHAAITALITHWLVVNKKIEAAFECRRMPSEV